MVDDLENTPTGTINDNPREHLSVFYEQHVIDAFRWRKAFP